MTKSPFYRIIKTNLVLLFFLPYIKRDCRVYYKNLWGLLFLACGDVSACRQPAAKISRLAQRMCQMKQKLNRLLAGALGALGAVFFLADPALPVNAAEQAPPSIISQTAVVMDAESGQVLYNKSMNQRMPPASITKIVTGILAAEQGDMDEMITMSEQAVFSIPRYSTHIALDTDERLSLNDAMYAMMLMSANDATAGIAEALGGTEEQFVDQMNSFVQEIGATGTHFVNPHGLIDPDHYTTAYDMALITRYAIQNETFMTYFGGVTYEMGPTNKQPESRRFANQNQLLQKGAYTYEGATGGKVGYTEEALYTMVTTAQRDGRTLICVVMKSPEYADKFEDTAKLLDFGFEAFHSAPLTETELPRQSIAVQVIGDQDDVREEGKMLIFLKEPVKLLLPQGVELEDCEITYNFRDGMTLPGAFAPQAVISMKNPPEGWKEELTTVPLSFLWELDPLALPAQQKPEEEVPVKAPSFWGKVFKVTAWVFLSLLGMLFVTRQLILFDIRKKKRQKRERERKRQLQAAQMQPAPPVRRSPPAQEWQYSNPYHNAARTAQRPEVRRVNSRPVRRPPMGKRQG